MRSELSYATTPTLRRFDTRLSLNSSLGVDYCNCDSLLLDLQLRPQLIPSHSIGLCWLLPVFHRSFTGTEPSLRHDEENNACSSIFMWNPRPCVGAANQGADEVIGFEDGAILTSLELSLFYVRDPQVYRSTKSYIVKGSRKQDYFAISAVDVSTL